MQLTALCLLDEDGGLTSFPIIWANLRRLAWKSVLIVSECMDIDCRAVANSVKKAESEARGMMTSLALL